MIVCEETALERRAGLPDALQIAVTEIPRRAWPEHPNFKGLARYWMDRHVLFRNLTEDLQSDVRTRLEQNLAAEALAARVSRLGGGLVNGLHQHHDVEDRHYFPVLRELDPRLDRGFDLLDADHVALDQFLADLTDAANIVMRGGDRENAGRFLKELERFAPFLHRHLEDEEDLIVPVILKAGLR